MLDSKKILFLRPEPAATNPKGEFAIAPISTVYVQANSLFETPKPDPGRDKTALSFSVSLPDTTPCLKDEKNI
jgi:hypothetical protein